jgi:membrane associated rhomboid family serine protease
VNTRFQLRHRRPSLVRSAIPAVLALGLGLWKILEGGVPSDEWPLFLGVVMMATLAPFVVFGLLGRPVLEQWMEVRPKSILLPATSFSRDAIEIPIAEVRSIYARLTRDGSVWIETTYRSFIFPIRSFESPSTAALLVDRVRQCIRQLPDGDDRIAAIDRDARIAERALSTRHPATIGAVALMIAAGVTLYLWGGDGAQRLFGFVRFGANVDFLVREGEWYRLIASLFLHAHPIHLGFVLFGIATAGAIVERLLGSLGAILIMLVSGLAGAAAMHTGSSMLGLGANPIVFGLMGAAAFATYHHRERIPNLLRPTMGMWLLIGVFTLPMSLIRGVDFNINIGGLLGGVIAGALLAGDDEALPLRGWRPRWAVPVTLLFLAAYAVGLGQAVLAWQDYSRETNARVVARAIELDREDFNVIAWEIAIDPTATEKELDLAEVAARKAVERSDDTSLPSIEDTLATVQYRRGHFAEAIAIEKRVFEKNAHPLYASQLARFMAAGVATSTVASAARVEGGVQIDLTEARPQAGTAFLIAVADERAVGLVTVPLAAGQAAQRADVDLGAFPAGATLKVCAIDIGELHPIKAWPMDPEIAKLPLSRQ